MKARKPRSVSVGPIRFPEPEYKAMCLAASRLYVSMAWYIRAAVREKIERDKEKK